MRCEWPNYDCCASTGAVRHAQDWVADGDADSHQMKELQNQQSVKYTQGKRNLPIPLNPQRPKPSHLLTGRPDRTQSNNNDRIIEKANVYT